MVKVSLQKTLWVAAPSAKKYDSGSGFRNSPTDFVAVSVTGDRCALNCAHCGRRLIKNMLDVSEPGALASLVPKLVAQKSLGVLVSGGADSRGRVPLKAKLSEIAALKEAGLKVVVHTGLVNKQTATELKRVGVDQVLLDLIGDAETVSKVYGLPYKAQDYLQALDCLCAEGLTVVPHVVAGLNFGRIGAGEERAIQWVSGYPVPGLVLVILTPLPGSRMSGLAPPEPEEVKRLLDAARCQLEGRSLLLGCARPAGDRKTYYEKLAVDAGVDGIAYASPQTIEYAREMGYTVQYFRGCCSLVAGKIR
ncbi:MAG: radical SAM protein [Firmicutes bacterium]|nr:radical SAM protein [Bacillota bacterium]